MKTKILFAALMLLSSMAVSAGAAGSESTDRSNVETPKVYHAGGKHDQRAHEATLRARANGQRVERTPVHAGGRHDARSHEAAIKADEATRSEKELR